MTNNKPDIAPLDLIIHLNQLQNGCIIYDANDLILFSNHEALKILDLEENLSGKSIQEVWPEFINERRLHPNSSSGFVIAKKNLLCSFYLTKQENSTGLFFSTIENDANKAITKNVDFVLDHLPQGAIIADRYTPQFLYANSVIYSGLGYSKKDFLQLSLADIHPQQEMQRVIDSFRNMVEGQVTYVPRMHFKRKNGTIIVMDIHAVNIIYQSKECILGIFNDMTELVARETSNKEAYQQIKKQEQILKEVHKISKLGFWEYNFENNELTWSDETHTIFETNKFQDKISMELLMELIHPDDRKYVEESFDNHIRFKEKYEIVHRIITKNGHLKFLLESCETKYNFKNEPIKSIGVVKDITELKENEIDLKKHQLYLEQIANNVDEIFWLRSSELNNLLFINSAFEKIYKISLEEIKKNPQSFAKAIHPDDVHFTSEYFTTGELNAEHRIIRPDGEIRWLQSKAKWIIDEVGNKIANVGISKDITTEKVQRLLLEANEQRTKDLTNHAKMVLWEINENGLYTYVSDNCKEIWGYTDQELIGKMFYYDLHPIEDREIFKNDTQAVLHKKQEFVGLYNPIVKKTGEFRWMETNGIPTYNDKNEWIGYRGTDMDITEKKKAEDAITEKNKQLNLLIQSIPGAVFRTIKREPVVFEFISNYIKKITGYESEDFENKKIDFYNLVIEEDLDKMKHTITQAFKEKQGYQLTYRIRNKEQQIRWILETGEFIKVNNSINDSVLDGILFDITDNIFAEEEKVTAVLEATDAERKRIAGEVHEGLQQLLVAAKINLELSKQQLRFKENHALLPAYNLVLSLLSDAIQTTRTISHNLLPKQVKEDGLVTSIKSLLAEFNKSLKINFYAHDIDMRDDKIAMNLYRIVQESFNNIVKHAQATEVNINLTLDQHLLNLSIEDDGKGFDYEKIKNSESGIGLKSMLNRAKAMGAEMEINSTPNKGTLLMITVPYIQQTPNHS